MFNQFNIRPHFMVIAISLSILPMILLSVIGNYQGRSNSQFAREAILSVSDYDLKSTSNRIIRMAEAQHQLFKSGVQKAHAVFWEAKNAPGFYALLIFTTLVMTGAVWLVVHKLLARPAGGTSSTMDLNAGNADKTVPDYQRTINRINDLERVSQILENVTNTVRTISEQKNRLILKNAIETAREKGNCRDFAVVTDEVRTLSRELDDIIKQYKL